MSGAPHPSNNSKPFLQPAPCRTRSTVSVFPGVARPRRNTGQACDGCRQGKKKCDGAQPACASCIANQVECTYKGRDRRRLYVRNQELDELRAEKEEMAATLQALARAPEDVSLEMLENLRRSRRFLTDPQVTTSANSFSCQYPSSRSRSSESTPPNSARPSIPRIFAMSDLPPESEVREGAAGFFANTSALFYVMTFDEFDALLDRTYHSNTCVDVLNLCEICALASVGSQYLPEPLPLNEKQSLYLMATVHIRQCLELDKIRTIRILACLACYDIIEHREAARLSIAFGLRLARSELECATSDLGLLRRIYRTFIFAECWLATSLGFPPDLGGFERKFICRSRKSVNLAHMSEAEVQELAGEIALLKADILADARWENLDASIIDKHMARLDEWYCGLPTETRLAALLSDQSSPLPHSRRRGLLFIHILFLGTIILLHRRILTSMATEQLRDLSGLHKKLMTYRSRPVIAARQIAEIFRLVDHEKSIFGWCWLCMSEIYSSSSVLLLTASCKLADRNIAGIDEDISRADRLIQMLSGSRTVDPFARRLYSLLQPLHGVINDLQEATSNSIQGHAEAINFDPRCRTAMQASVSHLENVFGDIARIDMVNLEQSEKYMPTWWT